MYEVSSNIFYIYISRKIGSGPCCWVMEYIKSYIAEGPLWRGRVGFVYIFRLEETGKEDGVWSRS